MTQRPQNIHDKYHAHVYFNADSLDLATNICNRAGQLFNVKVGRVHERPIGPHPCWSCQLAFDRTQFDELIPWLEDNRSGLSILVHGLTGSDLEDHTVHASWLGDEVVLKLSVFNAS